MKGRVNLDKLTAFLEELRVSRSRTVSLGTLMCARDASAADTTHIVEVRCCDCCSRPTKLKPNRSCAMFFCLLVTIGYMVLTTALQFATHQLHTVLLLHAVCVAPQSMPIVATRALKLFVRLSIGVFLFICS